MARRLGLLRELDYSYELLPFLSTESACDMGIWFVNDKEEHNQLRVWERP